jgi:hypothetical protein
MAENLATKPIIPLIVTAIVVFTFGAIGIAYKGGGWISDKYEEYKTSQQANTGNNTNANRSNTMFSTNTQTNSNASYNASYNTNSYVANNQAPANAEVNSFRDIAANSPAANYNKMADAANKVAPAAPEPKTKGFINVEAGKLMYSPSRYGDVLDTFDEYTPIVINYRKSDTSEWYNVTIDGETGWMSGNDFKLNDSDKRP